MTIELHPEYLTKNGKKEFVVFGKAIESPLLQKH